MSKSKDSAFIQQDNANVPAQKGAPDAASKKLAKILKESTGEEIDSKNIVSTGKKIIEGQFSYMVDSWTVQKENPGYQLPKGIDPVNEHTGAKLDAKGNITNDFSYVIVNAEVQNIENKEITALVWGSFKLGIPGADMNQFLGSVDYLGEDEPRQYGRDYNKETFRTEETKKMALIFVAQDKLLKGKQLYLKINSSGAASVNPDYDVRRYIALN